MRPDPGPHEGTGGYKTIWAMLGACGWSGTQYPRDALSKGCNVAENLVGGSLALVLWVKLAFSFFSFCSPEFWLRFGLDGGVWFDLVVKRFGSVRFWLVFAFG